MWRFPCPRIIYQGNGYEYPHRLRDIEPDIQKPSFSSLRDEQKSAKIASESSLLVTYQCFFIEVAEKTTLAEPSLQRPQLFIHIGGAYENCVK